MRIVITFRAKELRLPLACNYIMQSFIYRVLSADTAFGTFMHDAGYRAGNKAFKLFSFRPPYGRYTIDGKDIVFHDSASFEVRSPDAAFLQTFFTACQQGRQFLLNGQTVTVVACQLKNAPLFQNTALVTAVSPITVHTTDETRHTTYYSPEQPAFYELIVRNAQRKWGSYYADAPFDFSIAPAENAACRSLVTTFKRTYITAWYGRFLLQGTPQVLDFLYHTGLGSRNSQGFGMFDMIQEK